MVRILVDGETDDLNKHTENNDNMIMVKSDDDEC